jgi:putative sigma-54 modulation protein
MKRFAKISKFFQTEPEAAVTVSTQKKMKIFEATIQHKGMFFRAEEMNEDIMTAIDKAVDVIESQIRKNRTKIEKKIFGGTVKFNIEDAEKDIDETDEFKIIRRKTVSAKPMSAEEAILQMNLLGHEFFMFTNAETGHINIVYKRKDGDYGLIEPEK